MRRSKLPQIEQLVENYYLSLFRFAERLCGSPTRALSLTQGVFVLALERSRQFPVPTNVRAWLFSLLFYKFLETRPNSPRA